MLKKRDYERGERMRSREELLKDRKIEFEIAHRKLKKGNSMANAHYHPYYELYYMVSGSRKFFVDHTLYSIKEGSIILINKNEIHRAMADGEAESNGISCSFSKSYREALVQKYGEEKIEELFKQRVLCFKGRDKNWIERLLHTMVIRYRHPDEYTKPMQSVFLEMLFIHLFRLLEYGQKDKMDTRLIENERIQQAAKYINENFSQELTLNKIAARYDMSLSSFSRKFKMVTGVSFKEYLIMRRIREACGYLIQSNLPITEIALRCGFNDSNYFGDAFKKVKGVSPRDYRKVSGFI